MNPLASSRRILAAALLFGLCGGCERQAEPPKSTVVVFEEPSASMRPPYFEIRDAGKAVEVSELDSGALKALSKVDWTPDEWTALFALHVEPADASDSAKRPPVLGSYRVEGDVLRFTPRFPLAPGVRYRAVYHPDRLPGGTGAAVERTLLLPKPPPAEATAVAQVYPTADRLPENQLKFYVHFTAAMSRGEAYRRIHLLGGDGKEVDHPFLELGEELWDPEYRRFTLLIDPGRIKRGLKPREEIGPSLVQGKTYTLVIDREWNDADGEPLKEAYRKTFKATAPDETPPDPKTWRLQAPPAGGKAPLTLAFPKAMDHALAERMLWVTDAGGRTVPGDVSVTDAETHWLFTPRAPWAAGAYRLVADTRLEDLAGNSIGRPFEVDVFHPTTTEVKTETVETPFEVRAADAPK